MNEAPVRKYRKYDENFKREAVRHWLASGKPAGTIARELGINPNLLYKWRPGFAPASGPGAAVPPPATLAGVQAQLAAALRENQHLREQRDILKKTLGILSEPPPSAINGSRK
jgi:transposase